MISNLLIIESCICIDSLNLLLLISLVYSFINSIDSTIWFKNTIGSLLTKKFSPYLSEYKVLSVGLWH